MDNKGLTVATFAGAIFYHHYSQTLRFDDQVESISASQYKKWFKRKSKIKSQKEMVLGLFDPEADGIMWTSCVKNQATAFEVQADDGTRFLAGLASGHLRDVAKPSTVHST